MGYGKVRYDLHDRRPLRARTLQEGASCGDVVEEAVDQYGSPFWVGGCGDLGGLPALDDDLRGRALARRGRQGERGDAGYGGERLAPESQGPHGLDVFDVPDLARRVPEHREGGVAAGHPRAVVADQDARGAAVCELDFDAGGARVEGVLD